MTRLLQDAYKEKSRRCQAWEKRYNLQAQVPRKKLQIYFCQFCCRFSLHARSSRFGMLWERPVHVCLPIPAKILLAPSIGNFSISFAGVIFARSVVVWCLKAKRLFIIASLEAGVRSTRIALGRRTTYPCARAPEGSNGRKRRRLQELVFFL